MEKTDYPLTADMLAAILDVGRIDTDKMRSALHDVLVLKRPVSAVAADHGLHRQQIYVHLKHIREKVKPAFDRYAALAHKATSGERLG